MANNAQYLTNGTEKEGLGTAILRQQPGNVSHAQAASYLGPFLEHLGIFEWNQKRKGICWKIVSTPNSLSQLEKIIASASTIKSVQNWGRDQSQSGSHVMANASNQFIVLVAADEEWRIVKEILRPAKVNRFPYGEWFSFSIDSKSLHKSVVFFHSGCGKIPASGGTQYVIDRFDPQILINLGTCGGFKGKVQANDVLLVKETVVYDICERAGHQKEQIEKYRTVFDLSWLEKPYPMNAILATMATADQDLSPETIPDLVENFGAVAADWESGAIAYVAHKNNVKCMIIRGVSDVVGAFDNKSSSENVIRNGTHSVMQRLVEGFLDWVPRSGFLRSKE